jgi:hypothetical protein
MQMYAGSKGGVLPFIISALSEGEWLASRPCYFTSYETATCTGTGTGTRCIGELAGPRVVLDAMGKSILPQPGTEPRFFGRQPVA